MIIMGSSYRSSKVKKYIATEEQQLALEVDKDWNALPRQDTMVVLTTHQSLVAVSHRSRPFLTDEGVQARGEGNQPISIWPIRCSRIVCDEAHKVKGYNTKVMQFMRVTATWSDHDLGEGFSYPSPYCWPVTGTAFDTSPGCMRGLMSTIAMPGWDHEKHENYNISPANLDNLGKQYLNLLQRKVPVQHAKVQELLQKFRHILPRIMIRRHENTIWYGKPLVKLPPCHISWQQFTTPPKYPESLARIRKGIRAAEWSAFRNSLAQWEEKPGGNKPQPPQKLTARRTAPSHQLRVLATFPALSSVHESNPRKYSLTDDDWKSNKETYLEDLELIGDDSPKAQFVLEKVKALQPDQKMIIVSEFPIVIEILQRVCSLPSSPNPHVVFLLKRVFLLGK